MKRKRQGIVLAATLFCAFSLLLAACSSQGRTLELSSSVAKLETPGATATSTMTGTPGASGRTEYVAEIPDMNAWFGLASDGKNVVGLITDGTPDRTATVAQWYQGTVTNNNVQASPVAQATPSTQATPGTQATSTVQGTATSGQGQLTAHLTQNAAIGTGTLNNGKKFSFTANAVTDPKAGLYYSIETLNNTKYLAGWIVPSGAVPAGTATPGATTTPGATATPTETVTPAATATASASVPGSATPSASATPSGTSTPTTGVNPAGGSAILNQQNGQLLQAPLPTAQDLDANQVTIPNLGTFHLKR